MQAARAIAPISARTLEAELGVKVSTAMLYTSAMVERTNPPAGQPRRQRACRSIYIHSKLMIHSDARFTLGSADGMAARLPSHLATPAVGSTAQSVASYKDERFSDHAPVTVDSALGI